jgi:hypothetical protein
MIQIVFTVYIGLIITAAFLAQFRSDYERIKADVLFIYRKGSKFHKLVMFVILPMALPFTIPYTIRNINKQKPRK